jgi:hypothetical protein
MPELGELDHEGDDPLVVQICELVELHVYTGLARRCDHLFISADGSCMLHIRGLQAHRMDIRTDKFVCYESNHVWLVNVGILGMWFLLWGLLCGLRHDLALPQAVHEQLVHLDQSSG